MHPETKLQTKTFTMKLQVKSEVATEKEITPPLFWKSPTGYEYRAVFSETDYREVYQCGDMSSLASRDCSERLDAIAHAFLNWEPISELEFITKMDEVLSVFSLTPTLKP